MADGILTPCNVARSWHWFRQVTAPCNVACGSKLVTVNSPSGSTLQCDTWLWDDMPLNSPKRPPYWNSTSGFDFDHITAVDMSFCTISEVLSKSDHHRQKKMTSCRLSRRRISSMLDFRDPIMDVLKTPITTYKIAQFPENRLFSFWRRDPRWRIFAILDFRGPVMGSLRSPCTTSYRSSIESIALNCFLRKSRFCILATDRQTNRRTDKQMDIIDAWSRSLAIASCGLKRSSDVVEKPRDVVCF